MDVNKSALAYHFMLIGKPALTCCVDIERMTKMYSR